MNFTEAQDYINSLGMFSYAPSLERMETAVKELSVKNEFPIIHIAGTNGKGSVSVMCAEALKSAGYKTGLFVSPHIIDFRERIQINGEYISEKDFCRITEIVKEANLTLTEFEFITVMMLIYFKEKKIDVAVIETGLGGRFDATNIMENKLVSVITKIGLDHTKILGDTVEKITREKCGIIGNTKTVSNPNQKPGVNDIIREYTKELIVPDYALLKDEKNGIGENEFTYKGEHYTVGMNGEYQTENALTAIETLKNCGLDITQNDIKQGVKNGFMPARMQVVSKNPLIIVDGAHNPDGAEVLIEFVGRIEPFTAIVGVMRDKNYEEVLRTVLPYAEKTICVKACDYKRALPAEELAAVASKYCENTACEDSLEAALCNAKKEGKPVVVFGSLYLASDFLKLF